MRETQSQDIHIFTLGNTQGEENPTKLPLYRCIKSAKIKPQIGALSPCRYVSLSPMRYTQVSVCVQMRNTPPLFILFLLLEFYPNKSPTTNLLGPLHLGRHNTILYYIQEGTLNPTYN